MVRVELNYTVIFVTSLVTTVSYMQFLLLKCKDIQQIHLCSLERRKTSLSEIIFGDNFFFE